MTCHSDIRFWLVIIIYYFFFHYSLSLKSGGVGLLKTPKFIVFLSNLLMLFRCYLACKADNPLVESKVMGTMIEVTTICASSTCSKRENVWTSQPYFERTRIPACNLLLPFSTVSAEGTGTKILRIFDHMGLSSSSLNKFM